MRSAVFWGLMQRRMVVRYGRFGTVGHIFKRQADLDCLTLEALHKVPEEHRSQNYTELRRNRITYSFWEVMEMCMLSVGIETVRILRNETIGSTHARSQSSKTT
jgi:predicted DNA-binding WGR domain protein